MDYLLNKDFASSFLFGSDKFAVSHGVLPEKKYLGTSLLYFSFAYMLPAKIAVVLGSGEGFVPRVLRQAQKEIENKMFQKESLCLLIDANINDKGFGKPLYHEDPDHFHHKLFPEIEIWKMTTDAGAKKLKKESIKIDYLHIDADHTFEQSLKDFENYLPLMNENFIISLHDTCSFLSGYLDGCTPRTAAYLRKEMEPGGKYADLEMIDFNKRSYTISSGFDQRSQCCGTAFIKPKVRVPWDHVYHILSPSKFI